MGIREVVERPPDREKKPRNALQEVMDDIATRDAMNTAQEYEKLTLDRKLAEEKIKIAELNQRSREFRDPLGNSNNDRSSELDPQFARMLASASSEEERQNILNAIMQIKSLGKVGIEAMIPMMLTWSKQNPNAPKNEMVEVAKILNENMRTMIGLVQANQPKQSDPMTTVTAIYQLLQNQRQEMLQQQPQQQQNVFERLITDPDLFNRVRTVFGGNAQATGDPNVMLEIERLRTERELQFKKMEHEDARWLADKQLDAESEKAKYNLIENALAGPLGKTLQAIGGAGASKISGVPQAPQAKPTTVEIQCPRCTKIFYSPAEAKSIICPHCGATLTAVKEEMPHATAEQSTEHHYQQDPPASTPPS